MRTRKGIIAVGIAAVALVVVGVSTIFADHEDGIAQNAACDVLYWETSEPSLTVPATANTPATAVLVTSDTIRAVCPFITLHNQFSASAAVEPGGFLSVFTRVTCQSGPCTTATAPFVQTQVCAPGNINTPGVNNLGQVFLSNPTAAADLRISGTTDTFCGATPPGAGQLRGGGSIYLVEVRAYVTNGTGAPGAAAARFDERSLAIELWNAASQP